MAVYVMGDIHGCFDEFQQMLNIIGFSDEDRLILSGDYIDRGEQNISMLRWLAKKPENVVAIKGNHDVEFCGHIDLMKIVDQTAELETDYDSPSDTLFLYQTVEYALKKSDASDSIYFDYYKTIQGMAESGQITFREMLEWRDMLEKLPYTFSLPIEDKICVVVHAGYCESDELTGEHFNNQEEFFIFAREEGLKYGLRNGIVIAGHTPTILKDSVFYTGGKIFKYFNKERNCTFYNIDCGCSYRAKLPGARLACLRLEDGKEFYV